jgi:tetratricopeptide (TPR) repeat protein
MDDAAQIAQRAAAHDPSNLLALEQLVSALADGGNQAALAQLSGVLERSAPGQPITLYCALRLSYLRADFSRAAELAAHLVPVVMTRAEAGRVLNLQGSSYAALGEHDRARTAFEASLAIAPRDPAVLVNLGMTELRSGNAPAAEERFAEALFLYPTLSPALEGMAQALEQQGKVRRAAAVRRVVVRAPG